MGHIAADQRISRCKSCGTEQASPADRGAPAGWLSLSVTVPPGVTTNKGRPFIWIGLYCCVACLLDNGPQLEQAEALAGWHDRA